MEKSKRKRKPNRRRWIVAVMLIVLAGCFPIGIKIINFINYINVVPHYDNILLSDIDDIFSDNLVEARLLEYLTIGVSTHAEVEAFGDEYLDDPYYPCRVNDPNTRTCYNIDRRPVFPCERRLLRIVFIFEDDILNGIEFDEDQICL